MARWPGVQTIRRLVAPVCDSGRRGWAVDRLCDRTGVAPSPASLKGWSRVPRGAPVSVLPIRGRSVRVLLDDEAHCGFDGGPYDGFTLSWPHQGRGLVPGRGRSVGRWLPARGSVHAFTSVSVDHPWSVLLGHATRRFGPHFFCRVLERWRLTARADMVPNYEQRPRRLGAGDVDHRVGAGVPVPCPAPLRTPKTGHLTSRDAFWGLSRARAV